MASHNYHSMCGCAQCYETERTMELDDEMRDQYQDGLVECPSFVAELALENEEAETIAIAMKSNNLREIGMALVNALYRAADELIVTRANESGITPGEAAKRLYEAYRPVNAKWFHFSQNNSGGDFHHDADAGIGINVWVEARTRVEAIARAQDIGLYFDGVRDGRDCDCCGDRWYEPWGDDASDHPKWYGDTVRPVKDGEEPTIDWGIQSYMHPLEGPFCAVVRERDGL